MPDSAPPTHDFANLGKLFPGLSAAEYERLDAWYTRYAALIARMYERISANSEVYALSCALTETIARPTMTPKADSQSITNPAIKE